MDVAGDFIFDAPQALVWQALQDPNVLGSVLPGGQGIKEIGENEYVGDLQIKVGPIQGTFQGQIKLSDIKPPESYQIEVDGKGAPGYVKAMGSLKLEPRDHQTFMAYSGQAQIGGRIASVGQRLLDASARSIIRQSLEGLNEYLKVQVAQQAAQETQAQQSGTSPEMAASSAPVPVIVVPSYKPPSQTQLAMTVAKDVFNDVVPEQYRPVVIGAIILAVLWFLRRIFRD